GLPENYEGRDVVVMKDGAWHLDGVELNPSKLPQHVDVVFNALHGEYGEDGTVQRLFDSLAIPYTRSTSFPSALGMNKVLAKSAFRHAGLKVPFGETYTVGHGEAEDIAQSAFRRVPSPWVVKPVSRGSSVGVSLAKSFAELIEAVKFAFEYAPAIMVEEFIRGREATAAVIDSFRGEHHYTPPPIQIIKPEHKPFFDYEAKYGGETREICPGHFTRGESAALQDAALRAHKALGLRHYSRSDFIVSPRGLYILESNTLPGLMEESLVPKALEAVGCTYEDFLDHVIGLALAGR
ncbi:MAG: ATP-grasp domain-containing protein, partial [Patescibacteria group bacterium]